MTIGGSLFLIALGAILAFAVTTTVAGVDINTVGWILMIVGGIGLVLGLIIYNRARAAYADPRVDPRNPRGPLV